MTPGAGRLGQTITVVGAGAANLKSTVAANLAATFALLDLPVALADADGGSSRALAAAAADGPDQPSVARLPWAGRGVRLADPSDARPGTSELLVVDPPARLGPATLAAVDAADLVLVPVDATALALRVLRQVAEHLAARVSAGAGRRHLRAVLGRRIPREADRWGLVDRVEETAPGALLHATLPMARSVRAAAPAAPAFQARRAMLYAPGTAAARAYAQLAHELLAALDEALPGLPDAPQQERMK